MTYLDPFVRAKPETNNADDYVQEAENSCIQYFAFC